MHLLVISYERLIANGSAGTTVMCGLVESALSKGWVVTYIALTTSKTPAEWEKPYKFSGAPSKLHLRTITYTEMKASRFTRFVGSFHHAAVRKINLTDIDAMALKESYDAIIAFDSLAITTAHDILAHKKIFILGDPAGRRLWHSTPWYNLTIKCKAIALDIGEYFFYRTLPKDAEISMFGSGHAAHWTRLLSRKVIDIRPFIPAPFLEIDEHINQKPILYFGGTLAGTASKQSFAIIFKGLLPALRLRFGALGFILRLVGDCPSSFVKMKDSFEEVEIMGRVISFEAELSRGDIFILPMNYPVGVRTRVCSALAAGNICLVHRAVLFNMPELIDCPAVKIANSPSEYMEAISQLPTGQKRLHLRHKAIDFFNQHYTAKVATEKLFNHL